MYHALLMPEVQANLFATIKEDEQTGRCTLAMLARTCSVLSEASMDALWSDLDGLRPLARCIYTANTVPLSDERTPESNHNMQPDLSVFYKYAHRVRTLDLSGQRTFLRRNSGHLSATDDFFAVICYAVPSPILRNLRRLTWAPGMSLNWLRHFLNPQLRSLKISNHRGSPESTLFALDRIPGLCPEIKSLTLQIIPLDGDSQQELAQSRISRVICSWGELEELDYNPMTREDILYLRGLSSLRTLRLLLNSHPSPNLPPDSLPFPLLHTLQVRTDTLETALTFMGAVKSSPKSVTIDVYTGVSRRETWNPELFGVLFDLVSRDSSRYQLQDFSMNFPYALGADPVNVSDMLRPLFLCCELRILRIYMTLRFILGDGDLRMMAAAWPRLEKLELIDSRPRVLLSGSYGHPNQPPHPPPPMLLPGSVQATQFQPPQPPPVTTQVNPHTLPAPPLSPALTFHPPDQTSRVIPAPPETTFHGLISLLELCPSLRYFDLAIDASKLDDLQDDKPGGGVYNRLVKRARLIDSPVGDPGVVARILLDILPELDSLAGENALLSYPHHNMTIHGWLAVRQIMLASKHATTQT